jgi:hypothetical protein
MMEVSITQLDRITTYYCLALLINKKIKYLNFHPEIIVYYGLIRFDNNWQSPFGLIYHKSYNRAQFYK